MQTSNRRCWLSLLGVGHYAFRIHCLTLVVVTSSNPTGGITGPLIASGGCIGSGRDFRMGWSDGWTTGRGQARPYGVFVHGTSQTGFQSLGSPRMRSAMMFALDIRCSAADDDAWPAKGTNAPHRPPVDRFVATR